MIHQKSFKFFIAQAKYGSSIVTHGYASNRFILKKFIQDVNVVLKTWSTRSGWCVSLDFFLPYWVMIISLMDLDEIVALMLILVWNLRTESADFSVFTYARLRKKNLTSSDLDPSFEKLFRNLPDSLFFTMTLIVLDLSRRILLDVFLYDHPFSSLVIHRIFSSDKVLFLILNL